MPQMENAFPCTNCTIIVNTGIKENEIYINTNTDVTARKDDFSD